MRRKGRTAKILAGATTLAVFCVSLACAHTTPPPEFAYDKSANFEGLKSYAWFDDPTEAMPEGNSIVDGQFIDRTIRDAVNQSLSKKGFEKVEKAPSFYVAYREGPAGGLSQGKWDLSTQQPAACPPDCSISLDNGIGPYGLRPDLSPSSVAETGTKYRKQWTMEVTIRDSNQRIVWLGVRTTGIGTNPQEVARDLKDAVASLLAKFPPRAATATR